MKNNGWLPEAKGLAKTDGVRPLGCWNRAGYSSRGVMWPWRIGWKSASPLSDRKLMTKLIHWARDHWPAKASKTSSLKLYDDRVYCSLSISRMSRLERAYRIRSGHYVQQMTRNKKRVFSCIFSFSSFLTNSLFYANTELFSLGDLRAKEDAGEAFCSGLI